MRVIKCIKRIKNSRRIHKIKDKAADIALWTPILLAIYAQMLVLTLYYNDTDNKRDSWQD